MDRSFGASTSVLHTPSPLDRKLPSQPSQSTYPSSLQPTSNSLVRKPSNPNSSSSSSAFATPARPASSGITRSGSDGTGTGTGGKTVRFSPPGVSQSHFPANYTGTPNAAAPPSRLVSSSPPKPSYGSTTATTMQRLPSALKPSSSAPSSPTKLPTMMKKESTSPPLGRGAVSQRLRVNSILLVLWWLGSRTNFYAYATGSLVAVVPSLDTPLHVVELCALGVVVCNIFESLYSLNKLSALTSTGVITYRQANGNGNGNGNGLSPRKSNMTSPFSNTVRSSPKTRPSPAMSPSPSITRINSSSSSTPSSPLSFSTPNASPFRKSSPQSMTPQTPASSTKNALSSLRRSTLGNGSPASGNESGGSEDGLLTAYLARHSPVASNLHRSVNSREAINRLLSE